MEGHGDNISEVFSRGQLTAVGGKRGPRYSPLGMFSCNKWETLVGRCFRRFLIRLVSLSFEELTRGLLRLAGDTSAQTQDARRSQTEYRWPEGLKSEYRWPETTCYSITFQQACITSGSGLCQPCIKLSHTSLNIAALLDVLLEFSTCLAHDAAVLLSHFRCQERALGGTSLA